MCGRVAQSNPSAFQDRLQAIVGSGLSDPRPLYNIGPTAPLLGVRERHDERQLDPYRWGLVPGFIDEPLTVKGTFNARSETVATKPMYRAAFRKRRLLVPVDGFYEWKTVAGEKRKQPNFFTRADGDVLVLAGLWEFWEREGRELRTATIITTAAGPDLEGVHDRQPVVLEPDVWERWLDPELDDVDELGAMLHASGGVLTRRRVGYDVGNVRNDSPELVERLVEEPGPNSE